jgi:hypothetical protein
MKDGELLDHDKLSKENQEKINSLQESVRTALSLLSVIFGEDKAFLIAILPENTEDIKPTDVLITTSSKCPGCTLETIFEAAAVMGVTHENGRKIFEPKTGEHIH